MPPPVVSVIIPAYNRPQRTQRAIESVSEQTYRPIELVVVDDGSQPPLRDELTVPISIVENVFFRKHEENRGGNVARNTGIDSASGEYLAFLDSDDEWKSEKLQRQVSRLADSEAEVSYTGVEQLNSNGKRNAINTAKQSGNLLAELITGNSIGTFSSVVVEAEAVNRVGKPDPEMPCWTDWEWYLRLAAEGLRFDAIEYPLTIRHNEGDQVSQSYAPKRDHAYPIIKRRIQELASTPKQKQIGFSHLDFHLGYAALVNQNYSEARRLFIKAIKRNPKQRIFYMYLLCTGPQYPVIRSIKRSFVRLSNI